MSQSFPTMEELVRGLIRHSNVTWLKSFSKNIEITNSFVAKFWALRDGLNLAAYLNPENHNWIEC